MSFLCHVSECFFFLFKVRFGALKVLEGLHARLGKDFMVLLSETIPFLAELMEGESRNFLRKPSGGFLSSHARVLAMSGITSRLVSSPFVTQRTVAFQ